MMLSRPLSCELSLPLRSSFSVSTAQLLEMK